MLPLDNANFLKIMISELHCCVAQVGRGWNTVVWMTRPAVFTVVYFSQSLKVSNHSMSCNRFSMDQIRTAFINEIMLLV